MPAKPEGRIVTFYSYKGGTGRSMALANFAWILASNGRRVLVIDWDLEAPGIHRYFRPFLTDPELTETDGLIDAFWELAGTALHSSQAASASLQPTATTSDSKEFDRVVDALTGAMRRLRPMELPSRSPGKYLPAAPKGKPNRDSRPQPEAKLFPSGGSIDLIGAGRQGPTYSARVNTFEWQRFYDLDGARLLEMAKSHLRSLYDWVLIDSRTGVSDTAGICTIQIPDTVVACFTPNRQSVSGVRDVLRSIREYDTGNIEGSLIRFFPMATRIENLEPRKLEASRAYFRTQLAEFLPDRYLNSPREYWDTMEIPHKTGYAFEELIAAFGDATGALGAADTMLSYMEEMSRLIAEDSQLAVAEITDSEREAVLSRYALEGSRSDVSMVTFTGQQEQRTSEAQDEILGQVRAKEQIWRTSGFRWRWLLSSRELDLLQESDRLEFGRNMRFYHSNSVRMQQFLTKANRAFLINIAVAVTACGFYGLFNGIGLDRFDRQMALMQALVASPFVYIALWVLSSLLYSRAPDRPYGLRGQDVLLQIGLGPLRAEVPDFDRAVPKWR